MNTGVIQQVFLLCCSSSQVSSKPLSHAGLRGLNSGGTVPLHAGVEVLQKSSGGGSSSGCIVMAGYVGLVQHLGVLVADPGVSGGGLAQPGLDFVVHGVPEVCLEDRVVQVDVPVVGPLVHDAVGCRLHACLGQRFLQL